MQEEGTVSGRLVNGEWKLTSSQITDDSFFALQREELVVNKSTVYSFFSLAEDSRWILQEERMM